MARKLEGNIAAVTGGTARAVAEWERLRRPHMNCDWTMLSPDEVITCVIQRPGAGAEKDRVPFGSGNSAGSAARSSSIGRLWFRL